MIFADVPPPNAQDYMVWLGCLSFTIFLFRQGTALFKDLRGKANRTEIANEPLQVTEHSPFVTAAAFTAVNLERKQNLERLENKFDESTRQTNDHITETFEKTRTEHKEDLADIYRRLNNHGERLAAIEARVTTQPLKPR